jgi:hypothetical protein
MLNGLKTEVKPNINSVEKVHHQLSNNGHPLDGALGGCWFTVAQIEVFAEGSNSGC